MSAISYIWCEYRFVWPLGKGCVFQMCEYKWSCNEHTFDVSTDLSGSLVRAVSFECMSHCKYSCQSNKQTNKNKMYFHVIANWISLQYFIFTDCNLIFVQFLFLDRWQISKLRRWKNVFLTNCVDDKLYYNESQWINENVHCETSWWNNTGQFKAN